MQTMGHHTLICLPTTANRVYELLVGWFFSKKYIEELIDEWAIFGQRVICQHHRGNSLNQPRLKSQPNALYSNCIKSSGISSCTAESNDSAKRNANDQRPFYGLPGDEFRQIIRQVSK